MTGSNVKGKTENGAASAGKTGRSGGSGKTGRISKSGRSGNAKYDIRESLRLSLIIFICYILATLITIGIVSIVVFGFGLEAGQPIGLFIFVLILLVACTILAFIFSFVRIHSMTKVMSNIESSLNAISHGDFSQELHVTIKEKYIAEIADDINNVSKELNSVSILKSDFIKNFSHEFKTPIVSIKGFSELLMTDPTLTEEEKQKYYRIIYDESTRLSELASASMLLSNLESQTCIPDMEDIRVDEQIEECALLLYREVEKKNIDAEIDISRFSVPGSRALLKELWLNLFSNAVKYTPEGGHIKVFSYETTSEYIICFQDDGIGISKEAQEHIFDEYYQEDPSRPGKGIGLGLSVCKKIADLHGFTILVSSQKGAGSAFSVHIRKDLPAVSAAA